MCVSQLTLGPFRIMVGQLGYEKMYIPDQSSQPYINLKTASYVLDER